MNAHKRIVSGQSLVESVVTLGVVILLVTGLVVGTTSALKYAQSSRARSTATHYASEGLELARRDRDSGWSSFARSGTFCVDATGNIPSESCVALENKYSRTVTYMYDETAQSVIVTSVVSWAEGDEVKEIALQTTLTNWK